MKKYKIAICYDYSNYIGGGVGRATFEIAKSLISLGHEVIIIHKEGIKCKIPGVKTYKIPFIKGPFIKSLYYSLRLPSIIKNLDVDLVITQCNTAPFFGKLSKPHIHLVHSFQLEEFKYSDLDINYLGELPLLTIFEYFNIRYADRVFVVNKYLCDEIKRKYDIQPIIIKWGVNTNKFKPAINKQVNSLPRIISVTSSNVKRKNVRSLIKICTQIKVELRITNSPYKELPMNVKDLGFISDAKLIHELQHANLFVLPSLQESFGVATLEALACNIPVVVTKTGIFQEIKKYDVGEVVENTEEDLLKGIKVALSKNYGSNPRSFAEKYSWTNGAKLIVKTLDSMKS